MLKTAYIVLATLAMVASVRWSIALIELDHLHMGYIDHGISAFITFVALFSGYFIAALGRNS